MSSAPPGHGRVERDLARTRGDRRQRLAAAPRAAARPAASARRTSPAPRAPGSPRRAHSASSSASASRVADDRHRAGPVDRRRRRSCRPTARAAQRPTPRGPRSTATPPLPTRLGARWLRSATTRAPRPRATARPPRTPRRSPPGSDRPPRPAAPRRPATAPPATTITANSTGCTTSTRSSPGAPSAPRSTSSSDQSDVLGQRLRTGLHPLGEHRRAVEQLQRHPRPLRALAGEHEHDPVPAAGARPRSGWPPALPRASASRPLRAAPRGRRRRSPPGGRTPSARRPASSPRRRASSSPSALQVLAQPLRLRAQRRARPGPTAPSASAPSPSGRCACGRGRRRPRAAPRVAAGCRAGAGGGSASTTWQLVPPTPNELTPASSGPSGVGHAPSCRCTLQPQLVQRDLGIGRSGS